jgi:ABC-type transport system involved in multi-copper enzyme maturation permease subunit
LNPIAVRLVQGGSRRMRHFYIRAVYLGALIIALLYALLFQVAQEQDYRALALAASGAFTATAYLQIALITLLAPVFMAGAIAQEANPRTWDILLATPMAAGEIVLGNLFGRLFFILALLFSSLPLFALTQYFGGVPGQTIFASYLIAACAACLVGSLAIALSVSRLVGKRAVFAFYVSVVSFIAITFAADRLSGGGSVVTYFTAMNPFLVLEALLDPTGYVREPAGTQAGLAKWFLETPVTTFCTLSVLLSVLLMAVSTLTVRIGGIAGLGGLGGRSGSSGAPWYRRMFGLSSKGSEYRAPRAVWHNPIAWREAAARNATFGRIVARWSFILVGALFGLGLVVYYHGGGIPSARFREILMYALTGELAVLTLVTLNMAATAVAKEREDGTLDLLLTTPMTPAQYLSGKLRGMITYLLPLVAVPVGTLLLAGLYVALNNGGLLAREGGVTVAYDLISAGPKQTIQLPVVVPEAAIALGAVTIPFLAFVVMVGMHWSLKSKGSLAAVVATVGVVGAVAGVVGLCAVSASKEFDVVGPVLGALSPASVLHCTIFPESGWKTMVNSQAGIGGARLALLIGAGVAAGIYLALVYGLRASMVHNFDMTVRKLAGSA